MWILFALVLFVLALIDHLRDGTPITWWWLVLTAMAFIAALVVSGCAH